VTSPSSKNKDTGEHQNGVSCVVYYVVTLRVSIILNMISEYFTKRNNVLSIGVRSPSRTLLLWRILQMEANEPRCGIDLVKEREQFEAALVRLRFMKDRVSELRARCELLRELRAEKPAETAMCSECGKEIEQGQGVTVKDSDGNPRSCYHRDCFKAIWVSQNWRVHYSSSGFLQISKKNL
jgi:ribosomal protein L24E